MTEVPTPSQITVPPSLALPELAEADAPPEIQHIYGEIRHFSGIALPALIWRHLGTHPEVLQDAWSAVRPLFVSGLVQTTAWHAATTALSGKTSGVTMAKLRSVHLPPAAEIAYGKVLASYNRANPLNMLSMRLLLSGMGGPDKTALPIPAATTAWQPPEAVEGVPAMAPLGEIGPLMRGQIDRLAADRTIDRTRVVPSLYRHLVQWPALMRIIHDDLEPRMRSGEVLASMGDVSRAIAVEEEKLAPFMPFMPRLAAVAGLRETLEQFSGGVIPEMIVVGRMLQNGLDQAE